MQGLAKLPVDSSFDAALTCKHLTTLSPERQILLASAFCESIGLTVDEAPQNRANQLAFVLRSNDTGQIVGYVKADNRKSGQIPAGIVENLEEAMRLDGVENGIIFSIQPFTEEAKAFAAGRKIELIDARSLYENILILPEESIVHIEEVAYAIYFTAPICPKCKTAMDKAENRVGTYWKCHNYPNCRQTFMW